MIFIRFFYIHFFDISKTTLKVKFKFFSCRMVADSARKVRMSLAAGTGVRGDAEFARGRRERVFKAAKRINSCYVIERIHSNKLTNCYFLKLCKLLGNQCR